MQRDQKLSEELETLKKLVNVMQTAFNRLFKGVCTVGYKTFFEYLLSIFRLY